MPSVSLIPSSDLRAPDISCPKLLLEFPGSDFIFLFISTDFSDNFESISFNLSSIFLIAVSCPFKLVSGVPSFVTIISLFSIFAFFAFNNSSLSFIRSFFSTLGAYSSIILSACSTVIFPESTALSILLIISSVVSLPVISNLDSDSEELFFLPLYDFVSISCFMLEEISYPELFELTSLPTLILDSPNDFIFTSAWFEILTAASLCPSARFIPAPIDSLTAKPPNVTSPVALIALCTTFESTPAIEVAASFIFDAKLVLIPVGSFGNLLNVETDSLYPTFPSAFAVASVNAGLPTFIPPFASFINLYFGSVPTAPGFLACKFVNSSAFSNTLVFCVSYFCCAVSTLFFRLSTVFWSELFVFW